MRKGLSHGGFSPLKYIARGGDAMATVTFSDLIQLGILIVGIIALCKKSSK